MAKMTTEEFIARAKQVHGDKYDYSLVEYVNAHTKIKIICPVHGVFEQTPDKHLQGQGCGKCIGKGITIDTFIEKARKIHGDKYDYSKVEYKNNSTKVTIICPEHGPFEQTPAAHWKGAGCPKCANNIPLTTEDFIRKAKEIHGNTYDYSFVDYKSSDDNVVIVCKKHNHKFEQRAANHLHGMGCPICRNEKIGDKLRGDKETFIHKAIELHGNKYDYSKVVYKKASEKVVIICREHNYEFEQTPNSHLGGSGCPICGGVYRMPKEEFIEKAKQVHGDKYDYSKVNFKNLTTKVTIICPEHGEFEQTPHDHLNGKGCSICNRGYSKQYKFNLLEEFESEYAFRAFLENHDINILLSILMNIEPKYEPLKKDIERALAHANEVNPIQSLREKYSSDAEESDDDDYIDDTDTTDTDDFDWDNDNEVNDMISQESETETDTDTDDELTIDDIIRNDEEEIRVINRLDSEHLITPEVREYIKSKYKNDMMRAWMAKRDNK